MDREQKNMSRLRAESYALKKLTPFFLFSDLGLNCSKLSIFLIKVNILAPAWDYIFLASGGLPRRNYAKMGVPNAMPLAGISALCPLLFTF